MSMKELIEQIGGRGRLEAISKFHSGMVFPPSHYEIEIMARALLAVLDVKPIAAISKEDLLQLRDSYRPVLAFRPDHVRNSPAEYLYTAPPAASNVKLPTTRLWAGAIECYAKDDVISVLRSAGIEVSDD